MQRTSSQPHAVLLAGRSRSSPAIVVVAPPAEIADGVRSKSIRSQLPSMASRSQLPSTASMMALALLLNLVQLVSGASPSSSPSTGSDPFSFGLSFTAGEGLEQTVALVMIMWGLVCLFFGVRLFKITLFAITWAAVGGLIYYVALLANPEGTKAAFICGMIFGLLAGLIVVKLFVLGLMIAGAFCAFILWSCFLTLFPNAVPHSAMYTVLALALVAGAALAYFYQKWILLFATPVIGTFLFSQGLSKYLDDPDMQLSVYHALHNGDGCTSDYCLGLFAGLGAIAITGFCVQWFLTSGLRTKSASKTKKAETEMELV